MLLEEVDDDLALEDEEDEMEESEDFHAIVLTPAAKVLNRNPGLFGEGVDFVELTTKLNQTGRNEPCPCESGKKFKKCCGTAV